ncbi:regulatory protein RecX [Methylolobus aquaticus]
MRAVSLRYLARRDYARAELAQRLRTKGFPADSVHTVLASLSAEGLLDDGRFAAMIVRRRAEQGYGRMRVVSELRQMGVDPSAIPDEDIDWDAVLERLYRKRFRAGPPTSDRELQSRWRYLLQRGFSSEQIRRVMQSPLPSDSFSDLPNH